MRPKAQMADLDERQLDLLFEIASLSFNYKMLEVGNHHIIEFDHEYGEDACRELVNIHFNELVCCFLSRQSAKNLARYVCQREVIVAVDGSEFFTEEDAVRVNCVRERNRRKVRTTCRKFLYADDAYFDRWYAYEEIDDEEGKM